MRTTIRLRDDLLKRAKKRAAEEKRTLTSLVEEGVILPDVNVLVHAFRKDASEHALYRRWLVSRVALAASGTLIRTGR